jgi:predicted transcriptional regulator
MARWPSLRPPPLARWGDSYVTRKGAKTAFHLTDVELELMSILWQRGEGTVRDVMANLPAERRLAYTSVSTVLRILEQKGAVAARKSGQSHIYVPKIDKQVYEASALKHIVSTLFNGTPRSLVARLIDEKDLTPDDLAQLRRLLDERLRP